MRPQHITPQYDKAAAWFRLKVLPWRKLTIVIDGFDNAGKSSFARFLAWQLGIPAIEADFAIIPDCKMLTHDLDLLLRLINKRLDNNRPVIIEGVFIQRALRQIGIEPDYVATVQAVGRRGSLTWQKEYRSYILDFPRMKSPDYKVSWRPEK